MPLPANEERGEVAVTVDGVDLVVAAEMEGLAQLSSVLQCRTLHELFERLSGAELGAMFATLQTCVVKGDAKAAMKAMKFSGARALSAAMVAVMVHHIGEEDLGNGRSAKGRRSTNSPGASG